ncbi:tyrosine-type recombinase/integrase [Candidatus Poribacteria bacterium]|nr:tyrosine-type recombinase/integrase [Candidatus Poribacteria bacterium]
MGREALHTGIRKSELFNLQWSDIDFDMGIITVQAKKDWHTKNYRSRILPITPVLFDVLQEHRRYYIENEIKSDYVFTFRGKRLRSNIKKSLGRIVKDAGLKNVTLHTLRHTFASQLVMAGVPLREVQELMGHRSYETTLQYAHLSQDHINQQVMKLPYAERSGKFRTLLGHSAGNFADTPRKGKPHEATSSQGL